jgi:cytochrome c oxidase subunit II
MGGSFTLFPTQGSTLAGRVDNLYFFMLAVTVFFTVLVAALVVVLAMKYRRRQTDDVGANIHGSTALEVIWTAIPLVIAMVMFVWGTSVYFALAKPPAEAMEVYIIGKRWMWKAQHLTGHREINQLHVPVGTPVKLLISSEDVIHSYYIPAFRQKMDAVPGKTTTMWFEATKAGTYQLFCAEYCGTQHSGMIGKVTAMEPREYQQWLAAGAPAGTLTSTGEQQFATLGCVTCHHEDGKGRGPSLVGVFGKPQQMANGSTVLADCASRS